MTEPHDGSGLFSGTAWHYARYRPGYPSAFVDDIVQTFGLDGTGRLLDLGCGGGQLTLPLARHVAEAIGMDPEPEMLTEAVKSAQSAHVTNVAWVQGSSADLPRDLGEFRLVTMGRSFHWMDREQVLETLDDMVHDDGGVVIVNDGCLVWSGTAWQQAIADLQQRFLPKLETGDAGDTETHEEILARSPFRNVRRLAYEFERTWTVEGIIGYLYSTSLPLRRLLGERLPAFEKAITDALLAIDDSGRFVEPVTLEALIATKG
jgi:ubiquinone/menaquinone biosynthesis C-methylase UbiE